MLEKLIAYYCAPALAGIKPANIAACHKSRIPNIHEEIVRLNDELNSRDIYIDILSECDERVLVIAYRKKVLGEHLQKSDMNEFLSKFNYPQYVTVSEYINFLKSRICKDNFPHEIGVFLGYPLHDICGFINHRDDGCILVGEWKVYDDAEAAQKLFSRYKACRNALSKKVINGITLKNIFCVA